MSRVAMFVYNDCRNDARVLREAGALAAAGHDVTIMARPTDLRAREIEREHRDGFEIVRVPLPTAWRRYLAWLRSPWRTKGWVFRWVKLRWRNSLRRLPRSFVNAILATWFVLFLVVWAMIQKTLRILAWLFRWDHLPGGPTADWLFRWRTVIYGWGREAALMAPVADVYHGHDLTALGGAILAGQAHGKPVVYDSHEIFLESGSNATRPRWIRAVFRWLEDRLGQFLEAAMSREAAVVQRDGHSGTQAHGTPKTALRHGRREPP